MPVCAVPTCATTHRAIDKTLYRFPNDANYARIWARCCMKKDSFNAKSAFICSLHFADEAYQRDINHDILGYSSRRNLRKDALPTLQLPSLRMFRKGILEGKKSDDVSLLVDVIPALSPKNILKNIQFDFFNCGRINKNRMKFHHSYTKCRTKPMSFDNSADTSHHLSTENTENISEKNEKDASLSKIETGDQEDSDKSLQ